MLVHEYIHAIVLSRWVDVDVGWVTGGLFTLPKSAISRSRYLLSLVAPSIILVLLPLLIWIFVPFPNRTLSTALFVFSLGRLGGSIADFSNLILTKRRVPSDALVVIHKMNAYWYK